MQDKFSKDNLVERGRSHRKGAFIFFVNTVNYELVKKIKILYKSNDDKFK